MSIDDHLVRSTILDLHANLEFRLKQIIYYQMIPLVGHHLNERDAKRDRETLDRGIQDLSFSSLRIMLKPVLKCYGSSDIDHVWEINALRNQVAHGNIGRVRYRGRNPFRDHDALAQVYFDFWAAVQELGRFFDKRINGPRLIAQEHEEGCTQHYDCSKGLR